jgi:hypothetical protein
MRRTDGYKISRMFCTECGREGLSIPRQNQQQRESGHLKKLYCIYCCKETNHAELPPVGSYTEYDFKQEYELGRFVDGQRVPIDELIGCSNLECNYNVNGRCWNANHSYECSHRPKGDI